MEEIKNFISKHIGAIIGVIVAGAFYLLFVGILTLLFGYIEKKLSYYR